MILVAMVQLVYTVVWLVVLHVRPSCALLICILNTYLGTQLSYVMDQFFYITNKNLQSCNFAGNATYNSSATTASASAVASSCFANDAAVFTPSAPATSASSPRSSSKNGSGASVSLNLGAIVGTSVMAIVAVMSAAWTLAWCFLAKRKRKNCVILEHFILNWLLKDFLYIKITTIS